MRLVLVHSTPSLEVETAASLSLDFDLQSRESPDIAALPLSHMQPLAGMKPPSIMLMLL